MNRSAIDDTRKTQLPSRLRVAVAGAIDRLFDLGDRRRHALMQAQAGFGEADAARRALDQRHAQLVLHPPDGLAHGGPGHP